ncbi:hypothetical protein UFOVP208_21 [uncultured Caudovirales phage]|uniref:Uncharacterized protein n=1 Tax=uncultured Caudovirales phage TaxID=2100421 RepID=A0A6J7WR62_9CAUD|nr:hypothetical protein UFOVP208_21 [uncultured Caudovirales phage]
MILSKRIEHFGVTMDLIVDYNADIDHVDLVHNVFVKDETDGAEVDICDIMDAYGGNALYILVNKIDWNEQYLIALSELNSNL